MKKFSLIILFRDTEKEREFAKKSLPSALALEPDELIIGIDDPPKPDFIDYIYSVFKQDDTNIKTKNTRVDKSTKQQNNSSLKVITEQKLDSRHPLLERVKIIKVPRSNEWNLHLAHVHYKILQQCKNDYVYCFDVDGIIRKDILLGLDLVGKDNTAIVSFTKNLLQKNIRDKIKFITYRIRVNTAKDIFNGAFWIYKPYYFEYVDLAEFQKIYNGVDAYIVDKVRSLDKYKLISRKEMGVDCLDCQNRDIPWRQFLDGIHHYSMYLQSDDVKYAKNDRKQNICIKWFKSLKSYIKPLVFGLAVSLLYNRPYFLQGIFWARKHKDHEQTKLASTMSLYDWSLLGSMPLKEIKEWTQIGKKGTGYNEYIKSFNYS